MPGIEPRPATCMQGKLYKVTTLPAVQFFQPLEHVVLGKWELILEDVTRERKVCKKEGLLESSRWPWGHFAGKRETQVSQCGGRATHSRTW